MFCSNCGTHLPDNANFCSSCGKALKDTLPQTVSSYETCEIVRRTTNRGGIFREPKFRFVAEAIGPNGVYDAAISKTELRYDWYDREFYQTLESFIGELTADGWEYVGTYDDSKKDFAKRFRRKIQ